jgi:hypothetical protein
VLLLRHLSHAYRLTTIPTTHRPVAPIPRETGFLKVDYDHRLRAGRSVFASSDDQPVSLDWRAWLVHLLEEAIKRGGIAWTAADAALPDRLLSCCQRFAGRSKRARRPARRIVPAEDMFTSELERL